MSVDLRRDWWVGDRPLNILYPGNHTNLNTKVAELIVNGTWDLHILTPTVDADNRKLILDINLPQFSQVTDHPMWVNSGNGMFTSSAAYDLINRDTTDTSGWKWIWKIKTPAKFKTFLWLICHNRLPTNELSRIFSRVMPRAQ